MGLEAFTAHFEALFAARHEIESPGVLPPWTASNNISVTRDDVVAALHRLKSGKSAGNCCYSVDALKAHQHCGLHEALAVLVQYCLRSGLPAKLNAMLFMPLYKQRGNLSDPDNYRGISLIHPLGKVCAMVLLRKLEHAARTQDLHARC